MTSPLKVLVSTFIVLLSSVAMAQGFESDLKIVLKLASGASPARGLAAEIDLNEPPFYVMNHSEVSDIQEDQRSQYFKDVTKLSKQIKKLDSKAGTEALSMEDLKTAMGSETSWNQFMTRIYRSCQDGRNEKSCESLMDARVKAFEMRGRATIEDRQPHKAHSTSQPTTRPPSK